LGAKRAAVSPVPAQATPGAPQGPLRAYYGHHKCGTTWVLKILGDACELLGLVLANHDEIDKFYNGDLAKFRADHPFDVWAYTNADYTYVRMLDTIGFHVVRDPRDVIVSGYFSHLKSHPDHAWPRLRSYRPYLQTLTKEAGLMREIEFSGIYMHQMLVWDYGAKPSILEYRFEEMIAAPKQHFRRIFEHCGFMTGPLDAATLDAIVDKHSFANLSGGRAPGQEDAGSHYRRGIPGDWRNHFTDEHIAYFKSLYNPLLLKLGYEQTADWR
jgi:hypothetical protein